DSKPGGAGPQRVVLEAGRAYARLDRAPDDHTRKPVVELARLGHGEDQSVELQGGHVTLGGQAAVPARGFGLVDPLDVKAAAKRKETEAGSGAQPEIGAPAGRRG